MDCRGRLRSRIGMVNQGIDLMDYSASVRDRSAAAFQAGLCYEHKDISGIL
jgi:hypothetical protein